MPADAGAGERRRRGLLVRRRIDDDRWLPDAATAAAAAHDVELPASAGAAQGADSRRRRALRVVGMRRRALRPRRPGRRRSARSLARWPSADRPTAEAVARRPGRRAGPRTKAVKLDDGDRGGIGRSARRGCRPAAGASSSGWPRAGAARRSSKHAAEIAATLLRARSTTTKQPDERADRRRRGSLIELPPATTRPSVDAARPDHAANASRAGRRAARRRSAERGAGGRHQRWSSELAALTPAGAAGGAARLARPGRLDGRPCSTRVDKGKVQLAELTLDQKQALAAHPDTGSRPRGQDAARAGAAACPTPTARR